jgi:two-component system, OmpR family, sensor kinase
VASPDSSTRSAARATFSALKRGPGLPRPLPRPLQRLPIRWRLAVTSALLTLVILLGFALVVGTLTTRRIRSDFNDDVRRQADRVSEFITLQPKQGNNVDCTTRADRYATNAVIRIVTLDGTYVCGQREPDFGPPVERTSERRGYRVEVRGLRSLTPGAGSAPIAWLEFARPTSDVDDTISRVRFFLGFGVLAGAALALLAGLAVARRAMAPIAELTEVAREIEYTRDPSRSIPHPRAEDEVAELARTLEAMLGALDASRSETESTLARQREFVADASHELRTPLTSVLANLEFLADELAGEPEEAATSALRSARRMRRLVADLLLLARADAGRAARHVPTDVGAVVVEAAAELEPVSGEHEITVDARPAIVSGARDDLHRLAGNLIENAINHTPPGTRIHASTAVAADGAVVLEVADDGPGIPPTLAPRVFERFVRGGGEKAGSSGLGLAIVRAVTEAHGGTVSLEPPVGELHGARFVVRLPADGGGGPGELPSTDETPSAVLS